jgi:hypothetical protein
MVVSARRPRCMPAAAGYICGPLSQRARLREAAAAPGSLRAQHLCCGETCSTSGSVPPLSSHCGPTSVTAAAILVTALIRILLVRDILNIGSTSTLPLKGSTAVSPRAAYRTTLTLFRYTSTAPGSSYPHGLPSERDHEYGHLASISTHELTCVVRRWAITISRFGLFGNHLIRLRLLRESSRLPRAGALPTQTAIGDFCEVTRLRRRMTGRIARPL